ncbi:hypothetical protein ACLRDC_00360 [Gluconacetobacter sacchari]|uniref:hypothetical protein n=1 Tax=Gluconacetobacter sacchari TaxID=92759 RepID=UPI0039B3B076
MIVLAHGIASYRMVMAQFSHGPSGNCNTKTIINDQKRALIKSTIFSIIYAVILMGCCGDGVRMVGNFHDSLGESTGGGSYRS